MMILLFGVLNDEQRALVERIFHEHRVHFQRISFKIVKSEEAAEDVVSTAFVKIMDNIEKISELPCPQMTAFCVTIVKNASIDVLRHSQQSVHLDRWDCVSDESSDDLADECIHNADVRKLTELIDRLDRMANPQRYSLSSGANLVRINVSNYRNPSLHIWTRVGEELFEDTKFQIDYDVAKRHFNGQITDEEFVNAVFDPQEQVNGKQAELLGAVFTLAAGGPAEVHVGTGTGGSSSDLPWNDNVAKKHTSIKRR